MPTINFKSTNDKKQAIEFNDENAQTKVLLLLKKQSKMKWERNWNKISCVFMERELFLTSYEIK
jgi:hypothetical protein